MQTQNPADVSGPGAAALTRYRRARFAVGVRIAVRGPYLLAASMNVDPDTTAPGNFVPFAAATDAFGTKFASGRSAPRPSMVAGARNQGSMRGGWTAADS
jgi:hypothetical protein